jgi:hypothetical protein
MGIHVANWNGDSIDDPSIAQMIDILAGIDTTDEEHGVAWLSTDAHSLEWHGAERGRIVFLSTTPRRADGRPGTSSGHRHLLDVSRERTLVLWRLLADGRLADLEQHGWLPGDGKPLDPSREARFAAAQLHGDQLFYDALGAERTDTPCRRAGCTRGAVSFSVLCRPHHFESVRGRASPFEH